MAAVATQQLELIDLLLSAGASVHATDAFGCTALSSASCPLDHQPNRAKLARGALPTASRQVSAPHPDLHPTPGGEAEGYGGEEGVLWTSRACTGRSHSQKSRFTCRP